MRRTFHFKDMNGRQLHYGDVVEDIYNRRIGVIVYNRYYDQPMLRLISQFSRVSRQYVEFPSETYEKFFIPKHSRLYWFIHGYRLDDLEFLYKNEREIF